LIPTKFDVQNKLFITN